MTPIYSHQEFAETSIKIGDEEKKVTIKVEGEVFKDSIFPYSQSPIKTRISCIEMESKELIGSPYFINEAIPKEALEKECRAFAKDIDGTLEYLTEGKHKKK
jgi:hypothetical protein